MDTRFKLIHQVIAELLIMLEWDLKLRDGYDSTMWFPSGVYQ